jgi:hypothetical protein
MSWRSVTKKGLVAGVLVTTLLWATACGEDTASKRLADAEGFWEAVEANDRDAALGYVDPAAIESEAVAPFGRASTLAGQFDWYEAVGWEWTLEGCVEGDAGSVECTATASNAWSEALDVDPVTGTFVVQFSEDGITGVVDEGESFLNQWSPMVFEVFAGWVERNHPEDAEVMFNFEVDVNPEILKLYEVNTDRFVKAQQGGVTSP